jgi:Putative DNA-binding domain
VPGVVDAQAWIARALIGAEQREAPPALVGGPSPSARFAIHVRNYEASLLAALASKFPATAWLAGAETVRDAARAFLRARPPREPCIAEYGADFPEFLAGFGRAQSLPYLRAFAELEWAVGRASIAADREPVDWSAFVALGAERLLGAKVGLHDGVGYLRAAWRVDELMKTFLQGAEPARFELVEADTCVEVRGSRGVVGIERIELAAFSFRSSLAAGATIDEAAVGALEHDDVFDAGDALKRLVHEKLAVELRASDEVCDP